LRRTTINNPNNVTLINDVTINGLLTFTDGRLILGNNKLTMGSLGSITGASSTRFIEINGTGRLAMRARTTGTLFPIGDGYNPLTITTATSTQIFEVGVSSGATDASGTAVTADAVGVTWEITPQGTDNFTVTTQWNGTDELSGFDRTKALQVYRTTNGTGSWIGYSATGASGSDPYTITSLTFTSVAGGSPYYLGVGTNTPGSPLPVKLTFFKGQMQTGSVKLDWQTASEQNSSHFTVERSADAKNWQSIGQVQAHGNSERLVNYKYIDDLGEVNLTGVIYYRLKQVDYNGEFEYSTYIAIKNSDAGGLQLVTIYANPVRNGVLQFSIEGNPANVQSVELNDLRGKRIRNIPVEGKQSLTANLDGVKPGLYLLRIRSTYGEQAQRVVVE
jgi:hypothetical protein